MKGLVGAGAKTASGLAGQFGNAIGKGPAGVKGLVGAGAKTASGLAGQFGNVIGKGAQPE